MIRMGWFRRKERVILVHEYVTGGGLAGQELPASWAAEGHAMRRAAAEDFAAVRGVKVVMTLDARFPDEPGPWEIARVGPGEERSVVTRLARDADGSLPIAPETEGLLYRRVQWIEQAGGRPLASQPSALLTTASKSSLADTLLAAGIRTPPVLFGWPPYLEAIDQAGSLNRRAIRRTEHLDPAWGRWDREPAGDEMAPGVPAVTAAERASLRETDWATLHPRFPVVLKPIDGAGTLDTHLIPDPQALADLLARRDPSPEAKVHALDWSDDELHETHFWVSFSRLGALLIQPYVPGDAMSASFLVDRRGRAHLVGVGRQDIEIRDGQFHYRGGTVPAGSPQLADEARRALDAVPGLCGWVGVDFIREDDGPATVLEINPRLTTSFVGWAKLLPAGTLARAMLDAFDAPHRLDRLNLSATLPTRRPLTFRPDGSILGAGS
jgi:predicted ATP-grasp superfamily ATP-dependent carboligase